MSGIGGGGRGGVIDLSEGFRVTKRFGLTGLTGLGEILDSSARKPSSENQQQLAGREFVFLETKTDLRFPDPDFNWVLGFGNTGNGRENNVAGDSSNIDSIRKGVRNAILSIGDIEIGLEEVNVIVEL